MIDGTFGSVLQAARLSVVDPRAAARALMAMRLPMQVRWMAFAMVVAGSSLLTIVAIRLSPSGGDPEVVSILARPFMLAAMQAAVLLLVAFLTDRVGKLAGGQGGFGDALLLLVWLQVILMLVQVAQIVLEVLMPPIAALLGLASLGLMLWLITHFVAELHGFKSLGAVFAGIIGTAFAASFVVALLLVPILGVN